MQFKISLKTRFFSGCFEPLKKDLKKNKIKFNESLISPSFDELHCHKTKIIIFHFRHGGGTHFLVLDIYCYPVTRKTQIMLQNMKVFIFSSPCRCFEKKRKNNTRILYDSLLKVQWLVARQGKGGGDEYEYEKVQKKK